MSLLNVSQPDQESYDGDLDGLRSEIATLRQQVAASTTKRVAGTGTPYTAPVIVTTPGGSGGTSGVTLNTPTGLLVNLGQTATGANLTLSSGVTGIVKADPTAGFSSAVAGTDYVAPSETIATTGGIVGGGDLSANRTLALSGYSGATTGYVPSTDGAGGLIWIPPGGGGGGSGTVTSVSLTAPSFLSVAGSPVVTAGTLALSLATQSANLVFAGPSSGSAAAPTFRALVAADIPTLPYGAGTVTSVAQTAPTSTFSVTGSPITSTGTLALSFVTQSANVGFLGPASGSAAVPTWRALVAADIPALPYGTGTVTSVALSAPSFLNVSGSPVTSTGTLALALANQSVNTFFAGPATGSSTAPTFRAIVNADLPASGVTAGTYGDGTHVAVPTVNTQGIITGITTVAISGGGSSPNFSDNESLGTGIGNLTTHNQDLALAHTPITGSVHLYVDISGSESYNLLRIYSGNFTVSGTTLSIPNSVFTSAGWTTGTTTFYADYRY